MDEDLIIGAAVAVGLGVAFALRWRYRGRVVDVTHLKAFGSFDGISAYLVRSPRGRRYVALEYVVEVEDREYEKQVLLSMKQAAALASHLRVAASPHASLVQARVAVRRERSRKAPAGKSGAEAHHEVERADP